MDKNTLISVTSILHNMAPILESFIKDVVDVLNNAYKHYEIVLIDNGSADNSVLLAKEIMSKQRNIRLIVLSREHDEQVAYTAAIENSIGDFVLIMHMDTDPPQLIVPMVELAVAGADIVTAEITGNRIEPIQYRLLSKIFYRLSNLLTEYRVDLNWSNFVCFSRKMVNAIVQVKDRMRYLKYMKTDIGFSHCTIQYEQINRSGITRNKNYWNRVFFAFDTIVSSSEKLIRFATSMSLLTSILSFMYILYALLIKLLRSNVAEGWASTSIILSFMFCVMFFILFIIGEYVALIYKETRKGPLYHIADEFNSSILFQNIRDKNVN